ncbi:hypothetical protein JCM11491_004425 [Sporobolomyces phaffii]
MSLVAPPSSGAIPPAPRIGTAGSPLDPPQHASLSPREGLGLGGIDMPEGMRSSAAEDRDRKFDTRYLAFKPPRAGHLRHAASVSSPPSLVPFVKSLHSSAQTSAVGPPAPSVTPRKFSLQPQSTTTTMGHSRKVSEEIISYPIISRIDSLPTFTPDEERRPAPVPTTTINGGSGDHSSYPRTTPPAAKSRAVDEDRTPTPKQRRPSRSTRSPPPPLDLDFTGVSNYSVFPVRTNVVAAAAKTRRGSNATMTDKMEKTSSSGSSAVGSRLKGLRISRHSSRTSSQFDSSDDEGSIMLDSGSYASGSSQAPPAHVGHRRTASEESPRIVQAVTFTRAKSAEDVVPSDLPIKHLVGRAGSEGAQPARTWNTASPALIPISEVKAAKAKAKALDSPTKKTATTPPPRATPTRLPSEASQSISISVKDSGSSSTQAKEFGKAALGRDGVTVCLKSYTKPEDMEVSWSCVPRVDDEGRPYTQWEMKFRPRPTTPSSSGAPPSLALPPLPCPSLPSSNSNFLNYRISATSSPAPSNFPPSLGRTYSTTSPLSQTIDPLVATALPQFESRRRKSSSTSTSRSDSFSNGTSFSSESSVGPPTPTSSVSGGHRRRKSSSISHALSSYDFESSKSAPPLPVPSYFDIPVPPTSRSAQIVSPPTRPESPSRTNRSSSYNAGRTTRQFSIDQSVYVPRSASVPEAGIYVSSNPPAPPVKSPRDHRFARCLPPTSEAKIECAILSNSSSSPSVSATSSSASTSTSTATSGGSFLASRAASRKQSIAAPPPSLSIPPTSLVDEPPTVAANRVTSPFAPSPLGRSNVVYSSSSQSDQQRTPTRPTHFKLPHATTTPPGYHAFSLPPSSSTEASFISAHSGRSREPSYNDPGVSEELVSHPSPCPSTDFDDDEDDDEEGDVFGARMAQGRQAKRMMSRWSDTETEEEGTSSNLGSTSSTGAAGLTSWGRIPDSNTTDEE